jgi:Zn-dependent protease with chaperone function
VDFFAAQDAARRQSRRLMVLFGAAVAAIIGVAYLPLHVTIGPGPGAPPDPGLLAAVAAVLLLVIGAGSAHRTGQLRAGGAAVATGAGGRFVPPASTDPAERRLLNIVEEMALASGVPVPIVFVLDAEEGVNAFAAGHTIHDAAIAVTAGALRLLDRAELQGVVAHEFSHILNGDMRLNIRLIGLLHGILLLTIAGRGLLHGAGGSGRGWTRRRRGGDVQLALVGAALVIVGSVGVAAGKLIRAALSRQREFLADAAAAQFTRDPGGLAGALRKIGAVPRGSHVDSHRAEELSHLFFASGFRRSVFGALDTHPPLEQRIRRLDPAWDGRYPVSPALARPPLSRRAQGTPGAAAFVASVGPTGPTGPTGPITPVAAAPAALLAATGAPSADHLAQAQRFLAGLPPELSAAAHDAREAQALIFALLRSKDPVVAEAERAVLRSFGGAALVAAVDALVPPVRALGGAARLALLDLALPALHALDGTHRATFRRAVHQVVRADGEATLFEYALARTLARHLAGPGDPPPPARALHSLRPLREDVQALLSALAWSDAADATSARAAFTAAVQRLPPGVGHLQLQPAGPPDLARIDRALRRLEAGSPGVRGRFLDACAHAVAHDGVVTGAEAELLRAVAEGLDCPIPPLLGSLPHPETVAASG